MNFVSEVRTVRTCVAISNLFFLLAWHPIQIETRSLFETSWLRTGKRWAPQPFPTHYFYQNGAAAAFRANHCFKKVTFSLCKKSCFDKCNCSNQTVKKISAEERSVSFELQRANLESTSKRIAFCKTRLLQEKPARASFSYMNGLKNGFWYFKYFNFHAKNKIEFFFWRWYLKCQIFNQCGYPF